MNRPITLLFEYSFNLFILLSSLVYIVFYTTDVVPAFNDIQKANETVFIQDNEVPKQVAWSGAQVVGKLYRLSEDNVTITVDTLKFENDNDVMLKASLVNTNANYKSAYTYGKDGKLTQIDFTTITN